MPFIDVVAEPPDLLCRDELRGIADRLDSIRSRIERAEEVTFGDVTLVVVTQHRICQLHETYFDDPSPTDVITFPADEFDGQSPIEGDISVCIEVAAEQAGDAGYSLQDEIVFLGTHGLLHLAGWNDQVPQDRARMLDRQRELMASESTCCQ